MRFFSLFISVLLLISFARPSFAGESCELPDFSKNPESWEAAGKLKVGRLLGKKGDKTAIAQASCAGPNLNFDAVTVENKECSFTPTPETWPGKMVLVLDEYKDAFCVTTARGLSDAYWVKKASVEIQNEKLPTEGAWAGAYRRGPSALYPGYSFDQIDIQKLPSGKFAVSGGVIYGAGEKPARRSLDGKWLGGGCGFYTLSQIDRQELYPENAVLKPDHVHVEMNVSSCDYRSGIEEQRERGRELSGCRIFLKKNGPFLLVRESEQCIHRSSWDTSASPSSSVGFHGIWIKDSNSIPSPRMDHALSMPLGR